jgi:hypothetical protein
MPKFLFSIALAAMVLAPAAGHSQMMSASATMYGAGPHGFDGFVGTWSCTNTTPSSMGGPAHTTLTITRTSVPGVLYYRSVGTGFDNAWYNVYVASKKTWQSPFIVSDGSYGTESTMQTGKKIVWVGTAYFADSGKMMPIRDTNTIGMNKYNDLGEVRSGGAWKAQYDVSCSRS